MKRPCAAPRSSEPGSKPVEPDLGPVPVLIPDEGEEKRVVCPAVRQVLATASARSNDQLP